MSHQDAQMLEGLSHGLEESGFYGRTKRRPSVSSLRWLRKEILLFSFLLWAVAGGVARADQAPILFQDRFDQAYPEVSPTIPPWTAVNSDTHPDHEATVRLDTANLFGKGTDNLFLEMRDSSPTVGEDRGSLQLTALNVINHEVVTLSFLVHEPASNDYPHQLTIQVFAGSGARTSANRAQVFPLRNGEVRSSESANGYYGEDVTRRLDLVINNSSQTIFYHGNQVLASGFADVWVDGELSAAGYTFARQADPGPIRSLDFSTFSNHNQRIFLDDITLFEDAVVGARLNPSVSFTFPLQLEMDKEPSELFGYYPGYTQNVPSFDSLNRPYLRSRGMDLDETGFVHTLANGEWVALDFLGAVRAAIPDFLRTYRGAGWISERVVFDEQDRAYMYLKVELTTGGFRNLLMMSTDYCRTWTVVNTGINGGEFAMEHDVGHNRLPGPPFMLLSRRQAAPHPDPWASYHEFHVTQPRVVNGKLDFPGTRHINDLLLSIGQHSGGSSFSVTGNGKTHFVWIEVTDDDVPGTPTYAATYDHASGMITSKVLIAYAPPKNNSHNRPGVVLDSEGYIHVVTGSHHGQNFYYTRSLQPNNVHGGWTVPTAVWGSGWRAVNGEDRGGQTYVSLVCDPDDTLHLVFRQWRHSDEYFSQGNYYAALSYQRKPKGGDWTDPRPLVLPEADQYSLYYQKLAVDRIGRLFLSFSHFNWSMGDAPETRYRKRMVILSDDAGDTWRLAETSDFHAGTVITTFEEWQTRNFSPEEQVDGLSGPEVDLLGEGVPNLLRYALGLGPRERAGVALPEISNEGGQLSLEYRRRTHATDLTYVVEVSNDLVTWTSGPGVVEEVVVGGTDDIDRIRASDLQDTTTSDRRFIRLSIER